MKGELSVKDQTQQGGRKKYLHMKEGTSNCFFLMKKIKKRKSTVDAVDEGKPGRGGNSQ